MITLEVATQIAHAAFREGAQLSVVNMSVVVTDPGGHIRVAMRADGQGIFGIETAKGKAVTALGFNRSTLKMKDAFDASATAAITAATGGRFVPLGGGIVIQDADARTIGAAGVSGGLPAIDDEIIIAAVEAIGLRVLR